MNWLVQWQQKIAGFFGRKAPSGVPSALEVGVALIERGEHAAAVQAFERALAHDPRNWPALTKASQARLSLNQYTEVVAYFDKAGQPSRIPPDTVVLFVRGLIGVGNFSRAYNVLKLHQAALAKTPEFWLLYSVAMQFLGQSAPSEAALRHYISFDSVANDILGRHGRVLGECGEYGQSRSILARAMRTEHPTIETLIAYARLKETFGEREPAIDVYEKILASVPNHIEAMTNLGNLMKQDGDFTQAESIYRQALAHKNTSTTLHRNLADLLGNTFRTEEAITELKHCVSQVPRNPYFLSDLIFAQHYSANVSNEELKRTAESWGDRHGRLDAQPAMPPSPSAGRPLRIGLLSGSFRQHPVGFLALPGLEGLDRTQFSLTCYANQVGGDTYTDRFRALSDRWRPVAHISDDQLASLIREDRIDILLEMSGHAAGHRLPVVARRVAPVQVKWIGGQFNTMGIDAIDYFLSDPIESPDNHDDLYFERIHRLPAVYACYEPPNDVPKVLPLPALTKGYVTFGSLNKPNKIGPTTVALWSQCLNAVPESRLILQGTSFDDPYVVEQAQSLFAAHGIEPSRIECRGFSPHRELFKSYHDIDIALDPHPYSGCLTTCEALWMGVPVATLPGPTFAGRHSASFLNATGLSDWIADDENGFVDLVVRQSKDLHALSEMRRTLRTRMSQSPLCDKKAFARDLGQALKDMWKEKMSEVAAAAA